jgi:diguanylate cyclase (GGDEF)-like protein
MERRTSTDWSLIANAGSSRRPTVDPVREALVRQELLDRVVDRTARGVLPGPPVAALVALAMLRAVSGWAALFWVLAVCVMSAVVWLECRSYRNRRRHGRTVEHWASGTLGIAGLAATWASSALVLYPVDDPVLVAVFVIVLGGIAALETLEKAGSVSCYVAATAPILVLLLVGLVIHERDALLVLVLLVVIFFAFLWLQGREVHRSLVETTRLRFDNHRLVDELQTKVRRDPLTRLVNRVGFAESLSRALVVATRDASNVAVALFDIDRFKAVNDSRGHGAGDMVLVETARRVERIMRGSDLLARLGGDEFCVLITGFRRPDDAIAIANRIRDQFAEPFDVGDAELDLSTSVGVAIARYGDTPDRLLRDADVAMYRAKASGRNRVELFDERLRSEIARSRDQERGLREAIAAGHLVTWFQPEIDLVSGRVVGAEALVRWVHPQRGVVPAQEFIGLAHDVGLLDAIGEMVVIEAGRHRRQLAADGLVEREFRIRCNVSPDSITRPGAADDLRALVERSGCDASMLVFEITETAVLRDVAEATRQLTALRSIGLCVDLDDFGTGYSSLSLLQRLPIDGLKIDRSFVTGIEESAENATIVGSVVDLAERLDLGVVAEGVETTAQRDKLRSLGVRRAQGYLWSPAVPIDELRRMIATGGDHADDAATSIAPA